MNYSICKKITLLFLVSLSGTLSLSALDAPTNDSTQEQNPMTAAIQDQRELWEAQLQKTLIQFGTVDTILEDLQLVVNNDQVKKIKNKRVIVEEIKNIRTIIETIRQEKFVQIDPFTLLMLNNILDSMIAHLSESIGQGFTELAEFDISLCVKRAQEQTIDFATLDLEKSLNDINAKLANLDKAAKNVGLKFHNKVYRKIDDYVIQPSIKYRIPQRTAKIGGAAFFTWLILWWWTERGTHPEDQPDLYRKLVDDKGNLIPLLDDNKKQIQDAQGILQWVSKELPKKQYYEWEYWLRDKVGAYAHVDRFGDLKEDKLSHFHFNGKNELGILGNLQLKWYEYNHGFIPLASAIAGYAYLCYNDLQDMKKWATLKVMEAHNKMMGGAYLGKKITIDDDEGGARIEPKITFDDLVGMEHAKEVLSLIVKYVEDPERWDRGSLTPEKGYLLTGPTRTGKSYMAEALCGEIKRVLKKQNRNPDEFGFYAIKSSYIEQHGIDSLLEMAKKEAPCVLFIDEIDLLRLQRTGETRLLNQFLLSMSGALENDPKKQVIILAATNKPENMDEALKQPGRFGKEIRFEYPNFNYRKTYLLKRLTPLCISLEAFNLDKLALETAGCSFEQLNTIIKVAFQKAKIFGHALTQDLLLHALDTEIRRIRFDETKDLPDSEKKLLAAHQAGHALATMLLKTTHHLAKVTIRPIQSVLKEETAFDAYYKDEEDKQKPIEYGKLFTYQNQDTLNINSKDELVNICKIQLAGHIAEEILLGSSGYSYHKDDTERALQIAKSIISQGVKIDRLPKTFQNEMFDKAFKLKRTCEDEVRALLEQHKTTLQLIANALQKSLTLDENEVDALIKTGKMPTAPVASDSQIIARDLGIKEEIPAAQAVPVACC